MVRNDGEMVYFVNVNGRPKNKRRFLSVNTGAVSISTWISFVFVSAIFITSFLYIFLLVSKKKIHQFNCTIKLLKSNNFILKSVYDCDTIEKICVNLGGRE